MRFVPSLRLALAVPLLLASAAHAAPIALTHGQVLDVERREVLADATVLIEDGRIRAVGPAGAVAVPAGAQRIDVRGKWVIPGLVDAHIHLFQSGGLYTRPDAIDLRRYRPYETERAWVRDNAGDLLKRYLAAGITTVIDIGGPMANYALRDRFNAAQGPSPDILLTGPLISTRQPPALAVEDPPILQTDTPEQAREQVRQQLPHKPDFIKIWYIVRPERPAEQTLPIVQAAIEEAHRHGLKAAVHATQLQTAKLALRAGADILVHGVGDAPVDEEFLALLKARRVPYIPTLVVSHGYARALSGKYVPSAHDLALANPETVGTLTDLKALVRHGYALRPRDPPGDTFPQTWLDNLKAVHDAGGLVATGTDAGNIGTLHASSYLDELMAMQQAGLDGWDLLQASTLNGARVLGREGETGSIVPGKRADLVVLDRDPLADPRNLGYVHRVVHRGTVYDPQVLVPDDTPLALAQRQLNAYNARDIEAFLAPYGDEVEVYGYPGRLIYRGKEKMRERYTSLFASSPELHCELVNRIVLGNTVIDQELVTGRNGQKVRAIAIYTVRDGKIARVEFVGE